MKESTTSTLTNSVIISFILAGANTKITTKELYKRALEEGNRQTHFNTYCPQKGKGADVQTRNNNGDLITWNKSGKLFNMDSQPKYRKGHESKLMEQSSTYSDVKPTRKANRKDFVGNGNILSWS